jgi:hypothetical protein
MDLSAADSRSRFLNPSYGNARTSRPRQAAKRAVPRLYGAACRGPCALTEMRARAGRARRLSAQFHDCMAPPVAARALIRGGSILAILSRRGVQCHCSRPGAPRFTGLMRTPSMWRSIDLSLLREVPQRRGGVLPDALQWVVGLRNSIAQSPAPPGGSERLPGDVRLTLGGSSATRRLGWLSGSPGFGKLPASVVGALVVNHRSKHSPGTVVSVDTTVRT